MPRLQLARHVAIYGACQALSALPPLLMIPVMTRYLAVADYGLVAVFSVAVTLLHPLVGLGIGRLMPVWCIQLQGAELSRRVAASLSAVAAAAVLFGGAFLALSLVVPEVSGFPVVLLSLAALSHGPQALLAAGLGRWQAESRPLRFGALQLLTAVSNVAVSVALVVGFGWGWEGRVAGHIAAVCAGGALAALGLGAIVACRPWPSVREVRQTVRTVLLPLLPYGVGATVLAAADRLLAVQWLDLREVGLYAAAYQLALPVPLLGDVINRALSPWILAQLERGDAASHRRCWAAVGAGIGCIALASAALGAVVFATSGWFLGPGFAGALAILPYLLVANVAGAAALVLSIFLLAAGRSGLMSAAMTVAMLGLAVAGVAFPPQASGESLAQCFAGANILLLLVTLGLAWGAFRGPRNRVRAPTWPDLGSRSSAS